MGGLESEREGGKWHKLGLSQANPERLFILHPSLLGGWTLFSTATALEGEREEKSYLSARNPSCSSILLRHWGGTVR